MPESKITASPDEAPSKSRVARAEKIAQMAEVWVVLAVARDPRTTHPAAIQNAINDLREIQKFLGKKPVDLSFFVKQARHEQGLCEHDTPHGHCLVCADIERRNARRT
jgi:hypothetical protein